MKWHISANSEGHTMNASSRALASAPQGNAASLRLAAHPLPEHSQYLTFTLGTEVFALGILSIKEIIEYASLTTIPMMPAYVLGVINLRGAVVPVINLPSRFGREPSVVGKRTCIVIVEVDTREGIQDVGLLAGTVNEVIAIAGHDIEPAHTFGTNVRADFLLGIGKVAGNFVTLLNADKALAFEEAKLTRHAEAMTCRLLPSPA